MQKSKLNRKKKQFRKISKKLFGPNELYEIFLRLFFFLSYVLYKIENSYI